MTARSTLAALRAAVLRAVVLPAVALRAAALHIVALQTGALEAVAPRVARRAVALLALAAAGAPATLALQSGAAAKSAPEALEGVLSALGVEPRDVGMRETDLAFMVHERPRSELARLLMTEPLRADGLTRVTGQLLSAAAKSSSPDLLAVVSRFNNRTVRRGLIGDPIEKFKKAAEADDALASVLRALGAADADIRAAADLPASVRRAAALVLLTAQEVPPWIKRGTRGAPTEFWIKFESKLREPLKTGEQEEKEEKEAPDVDYNLTYKRAAEEFPAEFVMVAAQDVVFAVEEAVRSLKADAALSSATFSYRASTRFGWVILAGSGDDVHAFDAPEGPDAAAKPRPESQTALLIIDTGGGDTYAQAGAAFSRQAPVGVAIDLAGDDTYRAPAANVASFGAGALGVGVLWDEAGDDTYEADRRALGYGEFGLGLLIDVAGRDVYKSIDSAQASATAGYGLLVDREGDDQYEAYRMSQAFAAVNAVAALVDLAGADRYVANDTDIRYPAPQSKEHNVSLAQGAASGWRAEYVDGVSVNGGVAILLDGGGDDTYTCGVFGQGVGYWYGAGLLIDLGGADSYLGQWYVQGAAAHFAAGVLVDRDGADRYDARMNMSQGAGHDLSVGILIDDAGNDTYQGSTLGLGASNAAGVGLMIDRGGDDRYETPAEQCLGWVNANEAYRSLFRSYGLFVDFAGRDVYTVRGAAGAPAGYAGGASAAPGRAGAKDGATWPTPANDGGPNRVIFGYGVDRP
ncbi:MAG: hypothetical protein CHACPFDD_01268 [Phycisphaerae bacterium]|nr:hypothetical protein [Phycisphaerae bacterium]